MALFAPDYRMTAVHDTSAQSSMCAPPPHRQRRARTKFSAAQRHHLEAFFLVQKYPDINQRQSLANLLGVDEARVQVSSDLLNNLLYYIFYNYDK